MVSLVNAKLKEINLGSQKLLPQSKTDFISIYILDNGHRSIVHVGRTVTALMGQCIT